LPTVAESGFPDYEIPAWFGSFAPAQTPQPIVSELAAWLTAALQAPEIKQKLLIQGLSSANLCGSEFAGTLRAEFDDLGRIIRESHIKAERASSSREKHAWCRGVTGIIPALRCLAHAPGM
jgi:tripartite-type tricarboxylate transporter receptor subunit TctC